MSRDDFHVNGKLNFPVPKEVKFSGLVSKGLRMF